MSINVNYKAALIAVGIGLLFCGFLAAMVLTTGCITAAKEIKKDILATPTPTPTPAPTPEIPIPTPRGTPVALSIEQKPIDPFSPGERFEGQWYQWKREDVSGLKDMNVGIMVYRHAWLDQYTWYNAAMGNYQVQLPTPGNRYFAVWVHEEQFGTNQSSDTRMWSFDENSFRLQYKDRLISDDTTHNPVNRIKELDEQTDYYGTGTAPPFGHKIVYTGHDPETGGYAAEDIGWLRMGKGNSIDGYLLFEVPAEDTYAEDLILLGSFSRFGSAYWRFGA